MQRIFHTPEGLHPGNRQQTRENHREDHGLRRAALQLERPGPAEEKRETGAHHGDFSGRLLHVQSIFEPLRPG